MTTDEERARIIKANRLLQAKVGAGPIDEKLVARSQRLIDNNDVDFAPMAEDYLRQLSEAASIAAATPNADTLQTMIDPVMQIKANATMFNYALVGALASIMLNFLETLESCDKDVVEIVQAYHRTMTLIIGNKMKGDGGAYGKELAVELKDACKRYFAKQASAGKSIRDKDAFFIDG